MVVESDRALRKFVAPEFIFGEGASLLAGRYARNFGLNNVLLVGDSHIVSFPWFESICTALDDAGVSWTLFSDVSENPRSVDVMRGAAVYASEECDGIVAVGGGSPMDCAKGIGIVSTNDQNILAFEGVDEVRVPGPPLICVPTTAGSAADVSQFAIVTDEIGKRKVTIVSKALVPDISLLDPVPLLTLSHDVTVDGGMDVLSHAIEAYVSNASSAVTDLHARAAIDLIVRTLPGAVERPGDLGLRYGAMMASLHAGLAFSNASLGAVHALAHAIGGYFDLSHGRTNAYLLEPVAAFNYDAAPGRYDDIAGLMGAACGGKEAFLSHLQAFMASLGVSGTLGDVGCRSAVIPHLVARAMADPCMATNPKELTPEDVRTIYDAAFRVSGP